MDLTMLIQECAPTVAIATMAALVAQESGGNPNAIGVNGGARLTRQPASPDEAVATARQLQKLSISFDVGLAQINSRNLQPLGLSLAAAFDPCRNLRAAEAVLGHCYDAASRRDGPGQRALQEALSCFNTGSHAKGLANGYVQGIYRSAALAGPALAQPALDPTSLRAPKERLANPARPPVGTSPLSHSTSSLVIGTTP